MSLNLVAPRGLWTSSTYIDGKLAHQFHRDRELHINKTPGGNLFIFFSLRSSTLQHQTGNSTEQRTINCVKYANESKRRRVITSLRMMNVIRNLDQNGLVFVRAADWLY